MADKQIRRAPWHDYRLPGRYMITIMKKPGTASLSEVALKNPHIPLSPENVYTRWSWAGKVIADKLYHISMLFPEFVVEQYTIMPDHVHFLLHVKKELPEVLGIYLARLKIIINNTSGIANVFDEGFNDQIISPKRSLDVIYRYIRENPYRLAVRRAFPDFFSRRNNIIVGGMPCSAYGNIQLLDNAFIEQVVVHRADSDATFEKNKDRWLYTAANGGVLVSPFISSREREIRCEAEELNGRFILIAERPFDEREKPAGKDFELCSEGRMLIISPTEQLTFGREACLKMNSLAEAISSYNLVQRKSDLEECKSC